MRSAAFVVLAGLPLLAGCAELRTEFIPTTNEPMSVHDQTVVKTGTQQVATGQDQIRDANGNIIATSTHYENQKVSWTEREWYPEQGGLRVDDESFFRIVGDKPNAEKFESYHSRGKTVNTVGWVMLGVGVGLLGGGVAMYEADKPQDNPDGSVTGGGAISKAGYASMTVGLLSGLIGGSLIYFGKHAAGATDARIVNDPDLFKRDARRYNEALQPTAAPVVVTAAAPVARHATFDPDEALAQLDAKVPSTCQKYAQLRCTQSLPTGTDRESFCARTVASLNDLAAKPNAARKCSTMLRNATPGM
jgi:hypothetical protein